MKKFFFLALASSFLWGCDSDSSVSVPAHQGHRVQTVEEGKSCGGDIRCRDGLVCRYGSEVRALSGVCVKKVEGVDMKCPPIQSPVCGLRERQKNGYLNECEAMRHGADILNEGLCKNAEVQGNCEAMVRGIGNCEMEIRGFEAVSGKCREVFASGCEGEVPFGSESECEETCG